MEFSTLQSPAELTAAQSLCPTQLTVHCERQVLSKILGPPYLKKGMTWSTSSEHTAIKSITFAIFSLCQALCHVDVMKFQPSQSCPASKGTVWVGCSAAQKIKKLRKLSYMHVCHEFVCGVPRCSFWNTCLWVSLKFETSCLSKFISPKSLGRASVAVYYFGSWASRPWQN